MRALSLTETDTRYRRRIPIDLTEPCWTWSGHINHEGYGKVMVDSQIKYVHRLVYQLHVGPIPTGWELDHACHTESVRRGLCAGGPCHHRACWNPAHVEAVSSRENSMRGNHPLFAVARSGICRKGLHDLTRSENVRSGKDGRRRCRLCANDGLTKWRSEQAKK